jgi:hypothetical protein
MTCANVSRRDRPGTGDAWFWARAFASRKFVTTSTQNQLLSTVNITKTIDVGRGVRWFVATVVPCPVCSLSLASVSHQVIFVRASPVIAMV